MVRLSLVPRDREFFNLFDEAGTNILHAAELLTRLMKSWPDAGGLGREILICEQEGDRITHDIIHRLNTTSVTPLDREDIFALASSLDDVVDFTEEAADFMGLYNIEAPMEQAQQLTRVLEDCCRNLSQALSRLRTSLSDLNHYFVEVNRLENEGDRITREALASLFRNGIDPMVVIRWKDIFERLEHAIDACEHVANILEGIVVKHA
jgi:predicted phosphate transport protein (TIGR00153 family)